MHIVHTQVSQPGGPGDQAKGPRVLDGERGEEEEVMMEGLGAGCIIEGVCMRYIHTCGRTALCMCTICTTFHMLGVECWGRGCSKHTALCSCTCVAGVQDVWRILTFAALLAVSNKGC